MTCPRMFTALAPTAIAIILTAFKFIKYLFCNYCSVLDIFRNWLEHSFRNCTKLLRANWLIAKCNQRTCDDHVAYSFPGSYVHTSNFLVFSKIDYIAISQTAITLSHIQKKKLKISIYHVAERSWIERPRDISQWSKRGCQQGWRKCTAKC